MRKKRETEGMWEIESKARDSQKGWLKTWAIGIIKRREYKKRDLQKLLEILYKCKIER